MPMDSSVDFSAFYRDETSFDTGRDNHRTRTGRFARKASRSIKQLFGNPIRRTESGRLCYVSRSDIFSVDSDTETDNDSPNIVRSQSCLSLVLREGESETSQGNNSRPDSFTSLQNESIPHGRSIGSSRGSWAELETSEETLDDNSLDDFDKESRRKSGGPNLTSRLRETFRSTIREAGYVKVRDMVRYVKRPRSAIERHAYKESKRASQSLDPSFVTESSEFDRRSSICSAWAHLPPPPPNASDNDIKRRLIIQSLVKTEKSYISSLETLQMNYRDRLLNMKVIDPIVVEQIFSGVQPILERHKMFGEQLDHVIMEWDTKQSIGEIFCGSFGSQMVLESYSNFINKLPENLELIRKLCSRKKEFLEFCCQQQNIQGDNLNLYGLMLKPVQRFPQFLLILQDLLSNTAFDHVDRVQIEQAVTTLDKLTEQLDQRREIQEQHQLYQKLVKISRELEGDTTGRVIKSGPCAEIVETGDEEVPIDVRDGILILTDKGKLIFLVGKEGKKARLKTNDASLDGCKIKWTSNITKLAMDDLRTSNPDLIGRIGDSGKIQTELEKISKMESLMESLELSDTSGLREQINLIKERMSDKLDLIGPPNAMTVSFSNRSASNWTKNLRFANGNSGRAWIDIIRGQKISLSKTKPVGWKTQEEDGQTTGADRVLPIFIGSICTTPEASIDEDHKRPDSVAFHAYPSPAYDGSIIFWNGTDDLVQITHINQEDDECIEPKETHIRVNERIFGRHVHQNISSISLTDQVTCLYQLYSAVWCFQANGDVYAFQDVEPFKRLGVTKNLTTDPAVQILTNRENQLIIATKNGGVYLAALSTSGTSFQLAIIKTLEEPSSFPTLLIDIPIRSEVWCCSNGHVSVLQRDVIVDRFDVPEVGKAPLSAGACIASGVWVARGDLAYLYLYHVHTKTMIQTYDLSKAAFEVQPVHSSFGVSSLTTIANLLIAGTTSGVIIALPLPKLPVSTPSIVGPAKASIHGPTGRVQCLTTAQPKFMNQDDSNPEIHLDAAVLFALGTGQRVPIVDQIFAKATHVTIWRCCA